MGGGAGLGQAMAVEFARLGAAVARLCGLVMLATCAAVTRPDRAAPTRKVTKCCSGTVGLEGVDHGGGVHAAMPSRSTCLEITLRLDGVTDLHGKLLDGKRQERALP